MPGNATKSYLIPYASNLVLGAQVGSATYIGPSFPPKLQESPLENRFWDLSFFNVVQDQLFSRINVDYKNLVYLGALQTAKYLPNLLIQNHMKGMLYSAESNLAIQVLNTFLITSAGITTFFTIGAIETKVTDEYKTVYVSTILAGSLGYYAYAQMETAATPTGAISLSPSGAALVTIGLTGSFIAPYIMHSLGIDKGGMFELDNIELLKLSIIGYTAVLSGGSTVAIVASAGLSSILLSDKMLEYVGFDQIDILGFDLVNLLSLSIITASSLATESLDTAAIAMSKIAAFSFAKANAVVGVEIVFDYKETICSYPLIDSACNLLGITIAEVEA